MKPTESFLAAAADAGIAFESGELDQLGQYLALLVEVNETTNLTRIVDPDDAWPRHILDALQLLALLGELPPEAKVLDVGSGGGLPAIPLAIVRPDLQFTLLEATGKKVEFLSSTAQALGMGNVNVVQDRAENAAAFRGVHRGVYHAVTARAVAPLSTLLELTIPFLVEGGLLLAIKGQKAEEEIEDAKKHCGNYAAWWSAPHGTRPARLWWWKSAGLRRGFILGGMVSPSVDRCNALGVKLSHP